MLRPLVVVAVGLLSLAGCGSGGGHVSDATASRIRTGFAALARDHGYSVDVSIATRHGTEDERTLSCLAVESDPARPDGNHLAITNWGASTVLDADGGCEGGGDPHVIYVDGDDVLVAAGPAPARYPTCVARFRRSSLSAAVRTQLAGFTKSQGPDVDRLLDLATTASGEGATVELELDPARAVTLSERSSASSAGREPDSERLTVGFAGATSSTVRSVETAARAGDDTLYVRVKYFKLTPATNGVLPDAHCIDARTGAIHDLDELKSALGL